MPASRDLRMLQAASNETLIGSWGRERILETLFLKDRSPATRWMEPII